MTQKYLRRKTRVELARDLAEMLRLHNPEEVERTLGHVSATILEELCSSVASSIGRPWDSFVRSGNRRCRGGGLHDLPVDKTE